MSRKLLIGSVVLSACFMLSACYEQGLVHDASLIPPDYSPDYAYVTKISEDGRTKRVLVPEACLAADAQSPADIGPERLPPGCANNYNLQRMVERKRDLQKGRTLGPAPAAPAARAAKGYIDGTDPRDPSNQGGGFRSGNATASDGPTITSEPTR